MTPVYVVVEVLNTPVAEGQAPEEAEQYITNVLGGFFSQEAAEVLFNNLKGDYGILELAILDEKADEHQEQVQGMVKMLNFAGELQQHLEDELSKHMSRMIGKNDGVIDLLHGLIDMVKTRTDRFKVVEGPAPDGHH